MLLSEKPKLFLSRLADADASATLTYLLEKFAKIKKDRALYCSQIDTAKINNKQEVKIHNLFIYEFKIILTIF